MDLKAEVNLSTTEVVTFLFMMSVFSKLFFKVVFQSCFQSRLSKLFSKSFFKVDGVAHRSHSDYAGCEKPSLARPRNKCGYLKCLLGLLIDARSVNIGSRQPANEFLTRNSMPSSATSPSLS